jgi:hypothetical protein
MTGGRRSSREAGSTFYVDAKIQRFFHEPVRVGEELHFRLNIKPCEDSSIYLLGGAHGHARPYPPFINDLSGLLLRHPAGANRICDMRLIINPERLILVWRGEQSPLLDTDPLMLLVYNLERYLHTLEVEAERRVKGRTLSPSQNIVKNKIIQEELFNFFVRQYGLMAFVGNYIDGILRRITELQTI